MFNQQELKTNLIRIVIIALLVLGFPTILKATCLSYLFVQSQISKPKLIPPKFDATPIYSLQHLEIYSLKSFPELHSFKPSDIKCIEAGTMHFKDVYILNIDLYRYGTFSDAEEAYNRDLEEQEILIYKHEGTGHNRYYVTYSKQGKYNDTGGLSRYYDTYATFLKGNLVLVFTRVSHEKEDPHLNESIKFIGQQMEHIYWEQQQSQEKEMR